MGKLKPYDFIPSEMPSWRLEPLDMFMVHIHPPTSQMLQDIEAWVSTKRGRVFAQDSLLSFVDCAGRITENFSTGPRFKHRPRELVETHCPSTDFSQQDEEETLGLLDAITYAASIHKLGLSQVVEIHKRVVGISTVGAPFRDPSCEACLSHLLDELDSCLTCLDQLCIAARVLPLFNLAAYFLSRFQVLHPFVDGNGRVGEVLVAVVLKEVAPFPHRVYHVGPHSKFFHYGIISTQLRRDEFTRLPDLAAFIIETAWLQWNSCDLSDDHLVEEDNKGVVLEPLGIEN